MNPKASYQEYAYLFKEEAFPALSTAARCNRGFVGQVAGDMDPLDVEAVRVAASKGEGFWLFVARP